jgi:hypothetical protein
MARSRCRQTITRLGAVALVVVSVLVGEPRPSRAPAQNAPGGGGFCMDPVAACTHTMFIPGSSTQPGSAPRTTYWTVELRSNPLFCRNPDGLERHFELRRIGTDELIYQRSECLGPATQGTAQPLPTVEEVWDVAPLPPPDLFTDPGCRGLVGIENHLWAAASPAVAATVDLAGWSLVVDAEPIAWRWQIDPLEVADGSGDRPVTRPAQYSSASPGSAAEPVAEHVFETAGRYGFSVSETWTGSFTATAGGVTLGPIPIGLVELTTTAPYRVVEVQAVLVGSSDTADAGAGASPVDPTAGLGCAQ